MEAPLVSSRKEEQRAVIRFLWSEGVPGADIYRRLCAQYGGRVLSRRSVYEWIEKFKEGRTSVRHRDGAGRPSTSTADDNIERTREMIAADRRVTVDDVANRLQISHGSAYEIIRDRLGYRNVGAAWLPKHLPEEERPEEGVDCGPRKGGDCGPRKGGDGGPQEGGDCGPQEGGDCGPRKGGDCGPRKGGDGGPRKGGDGGPQEGGDGGPRKGGDCGPQEGGDCGPQEGGDCGPRRGGDCGPRKGGDCGPRKGGDCGPRKGGDCGSKEGGDCGPKEGGDGGPNQGQRGGSAENIS